MYCHGLEDTSSYSTGDLLPKHALSSPAGRPFQPQGRGSSVRATRGPGLRVVPLAGAGCVSWGKPLHLPGPYRRDTLMIRGVAV